jgi:hypothetical protein
MEKKKNANGKKQKFGYFDCDIANCFNGSFYVTLPDYSAYAPME